MATLICPHCGMANRAGANFCNNCGTDLRAEEVPLPPDVELTEGESDGQEAAGTLPAEDASVPHQPDAWIARQPWLESEAEAEEAPATAPADPGRLIVGVQGLLPPLNLSSHPVPPSEPPIAAPELDADEARALQRLMGGHSTPVAAATYLAAPGRRPSLRLPWLFWVLGLAVLLPLLFQLGEPAGEPRLWPGVVDAFQAIETLPRDSRVQIFWAYDPATAGELNLVAQPVMRHLLDREASLAVVSLLPGGPATARRLTAAALFGIETEDALAAPADERLQIAEQTLRENVFLTGGVAALPLVAQNSTLAQTDPAGDSAPPVALAVVMAAEAEDVQYWLEQVQPRNGAPVIGVTSAAADPVLRPYLDSGQLRGLVSGFDGAYRYDELSGGVRQPAEELRLRARLIAQSWGQFTLLALIVLGNVVGLLRRSGE